MCRPSGVKTGRGEVEGPNVSGSASRVARAPRPARAGVTGRSAGPHAGGSGRDVPSARTTKWLPSADQSPGSRGPPASAASSRRSGSPATTTPTRGDRTRRSGSACRRATSASTGSRPRPGRSRARRSRRRAATKIAPGGACVVVVGAPREGEPLAVRRPRGGPRPQAGVAGRPGGNRHDPQRQVLLLVLGQPAVPAGDEDGGVPRRRVEDERLLRTAGPGARARRRRADACHAS